MEQHGTTWRTSRNQIASSNASVHFCRPLRVSAKLHLLETLKTQICKALCRNLFFFLFFFFVSFLCLHPGFCFFLRKNADLGFRSLPRKKITKKKQERKRKNKYKAPWRMFLVFHVVFLLWFVFWFVYFLFFVCVFFIIFWFPLN